MAGIESRNEKSAAALRLRPENSAPEIVLPERETPGRIAIPCMHPIRSASGTRISLSFLPFGFFLRSRSLKNSSADVSKNPNPRNWPFSALAKNEANGSTFLNRIAMSTVGTVARISIPTVLLMGCRISLIRIFQ